MKAQFLVITFSLMIAHYQSLTPTIYNGNSNPDPSAEDLLVPRVTQAQRTSIAHNTAERHENRLIFFRTIPGWMNNINFVK